MDPLSVLALAKQCASAAPALVIAAIALTETNGNPYAVQSAAGDAATRGVQEALQAATSATARGDSPAIGLALIPAYEFSDRSLSIRDGLAACTNLKVAAELVRVQYDALQGASDADWRRAALAYGTGNPDTPQINDYGTRFDAARKQLETASAQSGDTGTTPMEAPAPRTVSHEAISPPPAVTQDAPGRSWDVYGRSSTLLRFSN